MKRCMTCLMVLMFLTLGTSIGAQWSEGAGDQPRYLLFAKDDGSFLIVRLADWAIETITVPGAPHFSAGFLGVMRAKPIAIALTLNNNHTQDEVYLEVINLETKQVTLVNDPEGQTRIARYINMAYMCPDDPDHVYVLFSNKYNYGSIQYALASSFDKDEWIMARLQPETMKWEVLAKPLQKAQLDQIPVGGASLPYAVRNARRLAAEAKTKNIGLMVYRGRAELSAQLLIQGILKKPTTLRQRNILFYGEKYQFVWRDGTYALVKTENGKSVIVSECSREKAVELGFQKDLRNFSQDAVTALIVQPLKWF